jgi:hypothetical protein
VNHSRAHAREGAKSTSAHTGARSRDQLRLPPDDRVIVGEQRDPGVEAEREAGISEIPGQKAAETVRNLIGIGE